MDEVSKQQTILADHVSSAPPPLPRDSNQPYMIVMRKNMLTIEEKMTKIMMSKITTISPNEILEREIKNQPYMTLCNRA